MTVERAEVRGNAFALEGSSSIVALANTVDIGLVRWADGVAESSDFLVARLAAALIRVAVIVVSRRTVSADTFDADILRLADALLGDVTVVLIDALAGNNAASLSIGIISFTIETLRAGTLNDVVSLSTIALSTVEVVDLVGSTLNTADTLVNIIDLSSGALSTEVVNEVESRLADTASRNPVLIDVADRSANTIASLT